MRALMILCLVIAFAIAGVTWLIVPSLMRQPAPVAAAPKPAPVTRVLVAGQNLPAGTIVKADHVRWQAWPENGVAEGYIVEGKTAALFRWAMLAGARCAELDADGEAALERYGNHLGVAFQAVDDELDFAGFAGSETNAETGKDPLVDLREGKMTFPLIVALERQPHDEALALRGKAAVAQAKR